MAYQGIRDLLRRAPPGAAAGPVLVLLAEDGVEIASTLRHHLSAGFRSVLLFASPHIALPRPLPPGVTPIRADMAAPDAAQVAVNAAIRLAPPGTWIGYVYNAEYLFHPFRETRSVGEMLEFHAGERRDAMLTYVIDLYAGDLAASPDGVSDSDAHLDAEGYFALAREAGGGDAPPPERQLDFYGGLRWRFEEHVPPRRRRIDRIGVFRAQRGLLMDADGLFNRAEYNTYSCPWHHNLTAAICSFRAAKALRSNPRSRHAVGTFLWHGSTPFSWHSQQLLDLGLIEPGQWF
ncbi:MAG: hypothetical protein ACU0AT_14590 [Tranquillimonas sp.]